MLPKYHFILGIFYAMLLYFLFDQIGLVAAFIIWIASWFIIDLDHPLRYVVITHDFHPRRFWQWSMKTTKRWKSLSKNRQKEYKLPLFMFHGIEVMLLLLLLSYYSIMFWYIFLGFIFHHMCDYLDLYHKEGNLFMKVSLLYVWLYNRDKKPFAVIN